VREDTYSSTRKQKAAKKDNIIVLTSPKSLTSATITGEHDLSIGNIPRRKVPIAASATPMSVTASIPGGMSELNLTNNNLVTPSKESAVQPVSMVADNNTNVNSPGCQSFESVPQCIFTTAASEMEIVHGNNNSNINAMQIVSPKDSSTVASVSDSNSRMLQNPYARTNNTMNNNQLRPHTAASNVVHTSISCSGGWCYAKSECTSYTTKPVSIQGHFALCLHQHH
jgi:hypothetical protein